MAKVPVTFIQNGYSEIHNNLETIKKETKAITQSKVKINVNNKDIQDAIKSQEILSKTLIDLQKSYDQFGNKSSNAAKKLKTEINGINNALKNFETAIKWSGKVSKSIQDIVGNQSNIRIINEEVNAQQKKNTALKEQQKILNDLDKKAKDVGQLTKSLLQDKNLNQKGAKDTQAQWDYQVESIKRVSTEIKNAKGAGEQYKHMLESMAYEVKHTTGKSLFKDAEDGFKNLTNLENKRYEAQKSGKKVMEDYYNSEIEKQKQVISQIEQTATSPEKLQGLLKENANYIKNLLPENMQEDFMNQVNKTGMLDNAWSQGMTKYVNELKLAYENQVKLNQAKSQQNAQDTSYKTLKADLQEVWNLENRIAQLSKDPKHHLSEIQYLQQVVTNKRQTLNYDERIKELSEDQVAEIKNAEQAQKQLNGQIKAQGKDWNNNNKKVSELGDTIKKVFNYILVYRGFQMLRQGIQQAIDTMKELDKAFTDIQMVTGDTDEQTVELAKNYNSLAKEMGSTTKEVAEGAAEWLRQGKNTEETTQLLKSSMTLSKVGAIESSEATQLLTSSLNGYKLEAEDAMTVVDKISSIDLAAATSSYELATALSRTANSANDAGVSFDKLLAMIGTVSSVTRKSASTIGESFKTIFARMGNVAAGKDTDDMGEPLNDVEKTLNKMNIALRTTEGEWRNFETVLDEVAGRWKDFNSTEQSQIATAIAGVRQQENFRALMGNWDEVGRLVNVAANSTGSATERMGIYLDSIEAKTNNLKNAWEGFVMSLNQSESYKEFLDWLTKVVETLQFVDWKMVGIVAGVGSLITVILKLIPAIKTLITTIKAAGIAAGIASGGIVPLLGVIITLIGGVAAAWATASKNSEKHLDDIKKNKEELKNQSKEARSLYAEYQKLEAKKNIYGLTEKEKSDLVGVTKTLVEQYGFEYDSIDSLTGAYNLSQKALESYNAEVKRQMDIYNSEEYNEYIDKAKKAVTDYRSASNKGRGGWMTFTDWVGDLFGGDKDEDIKEAQSAGEFSQSLISALKSSIQMETGEEISNELSKLLENAVISGFENLDEDKLKNLGKDEIRGIIDNVTSFISSGEFKTLNTEIENGFKRFDKKKASSSPLTIDDYRFLNRLYEQQASVAYGVEYKAYGDQQQAANDALKSLDENTSNLGSTLAYLNDYLKENKDITDKAKNNFELFSNDVLKLNKDFSDGKIQIQEYFDTLYAKMQNITPDNLNNTFGNFETYSTVMGSAIQSITSYIQQLIATLQSAEIESDVFTTKMVDTIQSLAKFSSAYGNMYKATQGEEKYNEIFGAKQGDIRTYKSETKNGLFGKDQDGKFKWIRGEYSQANFTEEETQRLQNAISNAEDQHKDAYKSIEARNEYINKVVENAAGDFYNEHSVEGVTRNKLLQKYRNEQPEKYKESVTKAIQGYDQEHNTNYKNDIEAFTSSMTEEEKQLYLISKQLNNTADAEDDLNKSTTEVTEVFQESSKSLDDNIKDMERYANAIESWNVEKLDDAADIIQKGFETGDLSKEGLNDFDKISQEYQNAAMTMAQGLVNMYTSAVELGDGNMQKLAEQAYSSLGLVAGASQEQIARSLVATQSTFSNSATNMNRIAQLAMAQSLKSASGTIEQMANAIGQISVKLPIQLGGGESSIVYDGKELAKFKLPRI